MEKRIIHKLVQSADKYSTPHDFILTTLKYLNGVLDHVDRNKELLEVFHDCPQKYIDYYCNLTQESLTFAEYLQKVDAIWLHADAIMEIAEMEHDGIPDLPEPIPRCFTVHYSLQTFYNDLKKVSCFESYEEILIWLQERISKFIAWIGYRNGWIIYDGLQVRYGLLDSKHMITFKRRWSEGTITLPINKIIENEPLLFYDYEDIYYTQSEEMPRKWAAIPTQHNFLNIYINPLRVTHILEVDEVIIQPWVEFLWKDVCSENIESYIALLKWVKRGLCQIPLKKSAEIVMFKTPKPPEEKITQKNLAEIV